MPNILLTQRCVRSCPYCFAGRQMSDSNPDDILGWEDFIYLADLIVESGEPSASLLGGEPTLHPDIADYILYLNARGLRTVIFTSGIMSPSKLGALEKAIGRMPQDSVHFVCNLNDPEITPAGEGEQSSINSFLGIFGCITTPGFNIYHENFKLDFLFDLINRYNLNREVRLGLAHPIVGKENLYVKPDAIRRVVKKIVSYLPVMEALKIRPGLDCGFPMCAFGDEDLGRFFRQVGPSGTTFRCGVVTDIGPDMDVWACFPLSGVFRRSVFEFNSIAEIADFYTGIHHKARSELRGIFEECDGCRQFEFGYCSGGCVAHYIDHVPFDGAVS